MKIEEEANAPDITQEADAVSAQGSDEKSKDEDWSPEDLSAQDRAPYDKQVNAVDEFIERHLTYKPTDENRQAILDYLAEHDLAISPASLELCWEQLQDELDLETEKESNRVDEASRIRHASTAQLATSEPEEKPESAEESEPEENETPKTARGKPVAWRNGRRVGAVGE